MSATRLSIVLFALTGSVASDRTAEAGRFCDWLFGRNQTPYAVGYAPYAAGYAPYSSGYAPTVVTQSATGPLTQSVATRALSGLPANVAAVNGPYQAQRPAYDNPSVYTGMPVIMAPSPQTSFRLPTTNVAPIGQQLPTVSAYRPFIEARQQAAAANNVPIARVLRGGAAATSNPFYGTGNVYPNNYQVNRYQSNYPTAGIAGTTIPGTPLPATNVTPLFPNAPVYQPRVGGLARFFGSLWGTNYRTSYYRAPVTYYRPVTSVDPITGTTVTVQQPCTSTVQQLQRTPYDSLYAQGAAPNTFTPAPGANCTTPNSYLGGASVNTTPGSSLAPASAYGLQPQYGGVGQVGGVTSPGDPGASTIPSTIDPNYQPLNTQPLQGSPFGSGGDRQPMPQPELESAKPAVENPTPAAKESSGEDEDSYWGRRDREEKTALKSISPNQSAPSQRHSYSDLRPIEAPPNYRSPFRASQPTSATSSADRPSTAPITQKNLTAPPLLPSTRSGDQYIDLRGSTSASARGSVPIHEATMIRTLTPVAIPKKQPQREYGGWQAK